MGEDMIRAVQECTEPRRNDGAAAYYREWYKKNREKVLARTRAWKAQFTPEEWKARRKAEYERNKETYKASQRKRYYEQHERMLAERAKYRERNRERLRQEAKRYYREHPIEYAMWRDARRARLAEVPGRYTPQEYYELLKAHDFRCAYCGKRTTLVGDHRIPLARKELNPTNFITNILPACVPCNAAKHTMTEEEFRARRS